MRVPFEWLKEFVDLKVSPEEAAHKLTMIGLEVEAVERVDGDAVFEVNVTPNRPDCLSIIGIARELSAAYQIPYDLPEHDVLAEIGGLDFNVDILDTDLCHRYAGRVVRNLKIGESPDWLKKRLEKCGIRAINNVVDVTNYVLFELGHPLHAFDLRTIRGKRIRVGTPDTVQGRGTAVKIKTLDGAEREVSGDALLIWDAERPVAIAGVMGGSETEVADSTTDIFIESAYFDPASVRRTSKALGLKTESSYRFERGTDIKMLKKALDRAAYLMKEVAHGDVQGKIDIYPKRHIPTEIAVRHDRVNQIIGLRLTREEILNCLSGLGLEIEKSAGGLKVKPPAYRTDILKEHDVIEEVARIYGYDRIPSDLPKAVMGIEGRGATDNRQRVKNALKQALLKSGFTETINFSFMGIQDAELLGIGQDDERMHLVQIKNPLRAEEAFMRTTLIPSLLKNMVHNVSHGNRELRLFEVAKVFIVRSQKSEAGSQNESPEFKTPNSKLPLEKEQLSAIYYKEKTKTLYRDETPDFFIVKGLLESILCDLRIPDYSFVRSSEPFLHPGQSADVFIKGQKAGYIGALSPVIVENLEIKASNPSVVVMEMNVDILLSSMEQEIKYRPLPKYPYIERDTALVVDLSLESSVLIKWLKDYSSDLIEDIAVFDVYQGRSIPAGKKSIAFNVRYRAVDRTLTDEEIDALHNKLVAYILDKTKGQLRSS